MKSFLIIIVLLFGVVTSANSNENKDKFKIVTKDFTKLIIQEYSPHIDIYVPSIFKKINIPEQISFSGIDELHYNKESGSVVTLDPFKPLDEIKFEFGEDNNKSISYDDDGNIKFMFKKSFNWK